MHSIIKYQFLVVWAFSLLLFPPVALADQHSQNSIPFAPMVNQLADHPSPYLALHGSDPVNWQEWGPEVLARAKRENKLIFLSSGYFSCRWCHVMQRESFKNNDVARQLNDFFIPVKIDRELEPALDKRLINYAQATIQRGGWPLNVFISPDGLPVYAVLYEPQAEFLGLLNRLSGVWKQQSERIRELALAEKEPLGFADAEPVINTRLSNELNVLTVQGIMARADTFQGGFGESNKFPSVPQLNYLLDSLADSRNPEVIEFIELTLDDMALLGMRDHLAGGFYRYVVDPGWEIPHFEKMLYDNANLAQLYLKAGEVLDKPGYTDIARDTLNFMMRDMRSDNGALVASFSAVDEDEVEGGYYLWQTEQLKAILSQTEYPVFALAWDSERTPDLEAGNHLRGVRNATNIATELGMSEAQINNLLSAAKQKLLIARKQRTLPVDDKLLAGWNAQALSAFSIAAKQIDRPDYQTQAQKIRDFLINTLWQDPQLIRSISKGRRVGTASIEDYAFVSAGLFDWAELTGKDADYKWVETILTQGWKRFYSNNAWSYADTSLLPPVDGEEILSEDSSRSPSSSLILTTLAMQKAKKLQNNELYLKALSALNRGEDELRESPFWYVSQIRAMQLARTP